MFIVDNHLRTEMLVVIFATNWRDLGDSILYDCLIGFCKGAHQKLLSVTWNSETAEKLC